MSTAGPAPTIAAALRDVIHAWPDLIHAAPAGGFTGVAGCDDARLPGGTERLSLARDAQAWCAYWTRAVLDEHACATTLLHAHDVEAMATWLLEHADWIAAQDDGLDAAEEIDETARAIARIVAPSGVRRPVVGPCPHECEGQVRAQLGAEHDDRDLVCDLDPAHRWDEHRWRDLGAALGHITPAVPERMRPEQLAAWLTQRFGRPVSSSTIRTWASRHPWFPRPDAQGDYDRIRVTEWMLERHAA